MEGAEAEVPKNINSNKRCLSFLKDLPILPYSPSLKPDKLQNTPE